MQCWAAGDLETAGCGVVIVAAGMGRSLVAENCYVSELGIG